MPFKDHFSGVAAAYAKYRPQYPAALFQYLASITQGHAAAWDCATGNGQAALGLTPYYTSIIATDASAEQIAHATPHPQIRYAVMPAEQPTLADRSIDLVTVANALHWFVDFDRFYSAVRRVLQPGGVFAAWCYHDRQVDSPPITAILQRYDHEIIRDFWPPERRHVDNNYRDLPFPFTPIAAPAFVLEQHLDLAHFVGSLETTSAVKEYRRRMGTNPVDQIRDALTAAWGNPAQPRRVCWPITCLVGR